MTYHNVFKSLKENLLISTFKKSRDKKIVRKLFNNLLLLVKNYKMLLADSIILKRKFAKQKLKRIFLQIKKYS